MPIIASVLYLFTLYSLIGALERVDQSSDVGAMRNTARWMVVVFAALALLPAVRRSNDHSLFHLFLVFPLMYAVLFRRTTRVFLSFSRIKTVLRYPAIFSLTWVMETFLVVDYTRTGYQQNYGVEAKIIYGTPGALALHLYSYIGFYIGLAFVSGFMLWRYQISLKSAFITSGLWGLVVEQNFLGPKLLVSNPALFAIIGPWTFIIYGMYVIGPYLVYYEEIVARQRTETKYLSPKLFLALTVVPLLMWALWTRLIGR